MLENESLVSVIMPAYNAEKYIQDSIESVISQTYCNWELLIIDDGSKDNTQMIIERYKLKDNRIISLKNDKNVGVSATRNRGIDFANGKWIAFLDSDDVWEKTKLEKQIKLADTQDVDFIFTGVSYMNENSEPYKGIFEVPFSVDYKELRNQNVISCSSVLVNKKYFNNIKMERDDMHEDYAVWLRILKQGTVAYGLNEQLLKYRISRDSKSGNKIKTLKMTYKVFRFVGINPLGSAYFTTKHVLASVGKYRRIFSGK